MLLVFGSINVDLVFTLPALPRGGETVLGERYVVAPGGKGANQAVAAARDGARVAMVGRVGRDAFAATALGSLKEAGVDIGGVAADEAPTGCAAIAVDPQGRNQIMVAAGANAHVNAGQVADAGLGPETTLLLQMEVPRAANAALIERARRAGCRVILNLAPAGALPDAALGAVDILTVNETEAAWLAEGRGLRADQPPSLARALAAALGATVVLTLGAAGAVAATRDALWSVPALPVTPVDTTGAGDAFVGVLAAGLDRGLTLDAALRRASVAAGLACLTLGAQPSLPRRDAIDAELGRLPTPRRLV
jgi:ribokinase